MSELFKLVREKFSEKDKENQWTYQCLFTFTFNKKTITHITITDHYRKKLGRKMITNELILKLLIKMNGENLKLMKYDGEREPYEWEIIYDKKPYVLFFWFDDHNPHGLWIRNCHRID